MGGVIVERDRERDEGGMMAKQDAPAEIKPKSPEIRGWYRLVRGIVGALLRILARVEVVGLEYIP